MLAKGHWALQCQEFHYDHCSTIPRHIWPFAVSSAHRTVALSMIELRERAATFFADSGSYLFAFADSFSCKNCLCCCILPCQDPKFSRVKRALILSQRRALGATSKNENTYIALLDIINPVEPASAHAHSHLAPLVQVHPESGKGSYEIYIYIYICVHIYIYIHTYIYIYTHV